jgi:hypothetical protein
LVYTLLWFLLAALIGYLGRHRAAGFLGFFLASVFFSPLVAFLILVLSRPARPLE